MEISDLEKVIKNIKSKPIFANAKYINISIEEEFDPTDERVLVKCFYYGRIYTEIYSVARNEWIYAELNYGQEEEANDR